VADSECTGHVRSQYSSHYSSLLVSTVADYRLTAAVITLSTDCCSHYIIRVTAGTVTGHMSLTWGGFMNHE
jgi:hypothetical protein